MNFRQIFSSRSNDRRTVNVYRSTKSGMRVAFVQQPGIIVHHTFSFGTKAQNDSGLAHCIEHMIFMGCKQYPFTNGLDHIANFCFVTDIDGTTKEDHTEFTSASIGTDGLLRLIPVYMNYLLDPLLSDDSYITEVHHIMGNGKDGGVLYAEKAADEYKLSTIMERARRELIFDEGHPFRYDHGGTLKAIREECSIQGVKEIHKSFYNTSNLMVIIVGTVEETKILNAFSEHDIHTETRTRPFDNVLFKENYDFKLKNITFPTKSKLGEVSITWPGPKYDAPEVLAMTVLLSYFCNAPDSPLKQKVVDTGICSEISFISKERYRIEPTLIFANVPQEHLSDNNEKWIYQPLESLKNLQINMEQMKGIIQQKIQELKVTLEGNTADYYSNIFINYALYARESNPADTNYLQKRLNESEELQLLLDKTDTEWKELCIKYFNSNCVVIVAHPSSKLLEAIDQKEEERVLARIDELKEEGLNECSSILKLAIKSKNDASPSEDILQKFVTTQLPFQTPSSNLLKKISKLVLSKKAIPNLTYVKRKYEIKSGSDTMVCHEVDSHFIQVLYLIDFKNLSKNERELIPLLAELLTNSDIKINEKIVNPEKAAAMLKKDFISFDIQIGIEDEYEHFLVFSFTLLPEHISHVTKWMNIFLNNVIFEKEQIVASANDIRRLSYNSAKFVRALLTKMIADKDSNKLFKNPICSSIFYDTIVATCNTTEEEKSNLYLNQIMDLSEKIAKCSSNIHLIGNSENIDRVIKNGLKISNNLKSTILRGSIVRPNGYSINKGKTYGTDDSGQTGYLLQRGETKLDKGKLVYAKLFSKYLSMNGGPFFQLVRGKGLVYGIKISVTEDYGLELDIDRAVDLVKAYKECKRVVEEILSSNSLKNTLLIAAKNNIILDLTQNCDNATKSGITSVLEHLSGLKKNESFLTSQLDQMWNATSEKILTSIREAFQDLFDETKCIRSIVYPKYDMEQCKKFFNVIKEDNFF